MGNGLLTQDQTPVPTEQPKQDSTPSPANGNRDWVNQIVPENLRGEKFWANIKDPQDLAVKHAELVKYQGRSVAMPGKDAKPEDWEAFHSHFRPEKPDAYEMSREGMPENFPYNESLEKAAREQFHKLGLTTEQGKQLYNWYMEQNKGAFQELQTRYDKPQEDLRKEWGSGYDRELGLAQRALMTMVDGNTSHPLIKWLDASGESRNPVLIKFFNELGKGIGEDNMRVQDEGEHGMPQEDELKEVQKKIAAMRADAKGPYMDAQNPGHQIAVDEMRQLYLKKTEIENALKPGV